MEPGAQKYPAGHGVGPSVREALPQKKAAGHALAAPHPPVAELKK